MNRTPRVSLLQRCHPTIMMFHVVLLLGAAAVVDADTLPVALTVTTNPRPITATKPATLSVSFARIPGGKAIVPSQFELSHERSVHLVGLGRDLDTFFHVHNAGGAASAGKAFGFEGVVLPKAGDYLIALDGKVGGPQGGTVANHTTIAVAGSPKMASFKSSKFGVTRVIVRGIPIASPSSLDISPVSLSSLESPPKKGSPAGRYQVTLTGACTPGVSPSGFRWKVERELPGGKFEGMRDLVSYLGAPMHLAAASQDLKRFWHVHGMPVGGSPATDKAAGAPGGLAGLGMGAEGTARVAAPAAPSHSHGRRRRALQQAGDMAGMDMGSAAPAGSHSDEHQGHGSSDPEAASTDEHEGHDNTPSTFGPELSADVPLPSAGVYALVAQMRRGEEIIVAPFYVRCSGGGGGGGAASAAAAAPAGVDRSSGHAAHSG